MITPADILQVAESLNSQATKPEVNVRMIVGRAYYYAFHSCKERIESAKNQKIRAKENIHSKLVDFFSQGKKKQFKSISINLNTLRTSRSSADYELGKDMPATKADESIKISKAIVELLSSLSNEDICDLDLNF